jgi:tRNA threonylcarbamoyladenosine biosynthesis protein TsaB
MKGLILDTSTHSGYIILSDGEEVLQHYKIDSNKSNIASSLIPMIDSMLIQAKVPLSEIQYVAIGIGPGSFTGIRISATTALSLRYAKSIPIITYCSLESYIPSGNISSFFSVYDANMGGIYIVNGTRISDTQIEFTQAKQMDINTATTTIPSDSYIITPHQKTLVSKLPNTMQIVNAQPNASWICSLTYSKFLNNNFTNDSAIKLLYLKNLKHY